MLLAAEERVYDINPRWTADSRRRSRHPRKSDRFDALAVARYLREQAATLPALTAEGETAVLDPLTSEREAALSEATRLRNQLHALLLLVDPTYQRQFPDLRTAAALLPFARHVQFTTRLIRYIVCLMILDAWARKWLATSEAGLSEAQCRSDSHHRALHNSIAQRIAACQSARPVEFEARHSARLAQNLL